MFIKKSLIQKLSFLHKESPRIPLLSTFSTDKHNTPDKTPTEPKPLKLSFS